MGDSQVKIEALQRIAALSHIEPERLACLAKVMVQRTYSAGELIFLEGDPASGVWFIANGRVRIIKQALSGRVQALCLTHAGKCFGGCPLFDGEINPATAQAVDEVRLFVLPGEELQQFAATDPNLASVLLQVFSERFAHLARLGEGLGAWTVAARINDCLLAYADPGEPFPVAQLTHEKLASLAGTVREVVTRHLARLEAKGIIRTEAGTIVLLDADELSYPCLGSSA